MDVKQSEIFFFEIAGTQNLAIWVNDFRDWNKLTRYLNWQAPAKKSTGKKVAPAPYPVKGKQASKAAANPLIEKTPKNFGVGKFF